MKALLAALILMPALASAQVPLELPREKVCLDGGGLAALLGDTAVLDGLSREQIVLSMNDFMPKLAHCTRGLRADAQMELEIDVACTGRVESIEIKEDSGVDSTTRTCITETLKYTPFDANDMPDGYRFGYRLRLNRR